MPLTLRGSANAPIRTRRTRSRPSIDARHSRCRELEHRRSSSKHCCYSIPERSAHPASQNTMARRQPLTSHTWKRRLQPSEHKTHPPNHEPRSRRHEQGAVKHSISWCHSCFPELAPTAFDGYLQTCLTSEVIYIDSGDVLIEVMY